MLDTYLYYVIEDSVYFNLRKIFLLFLESMEKLLLEEYAIMKTIEEKESYRKNFINNVSAVE